MLSFSQLQPTSFPAKSGAQGRVEQVAAPDGRLFMLKTLTVRPEAWQATKVRTEALTALGLYDQNPFLAAPFVCQETKAGELVTLALFVEGQSLEECDPRPLTELLEIALHTACQWRTLEALGVAHGDIAPANILIGPDGASYFIDFDGACLPNPTIPKPDILGQQPMMAPELRNGTQPSPTLLTDRFAIAVFMSFLLLSRHPLTGLAHTPQETDHWMSQGTWPEHARTPTSGETPIQALGPKIIGLFDRAFSLSPAQRPSADKWQKVLAEARNHTYAHECGGAFVSDPHFDQGRLTCPYCGAQGDRAKAQCVGGSTSASLPSSLPPAIPSAPIIRFHMPDHGIEKTFTFSPSHILCLGRDTISALPQTISGQHLNLAWIRGQLHIQHIGTNPTLMEHQGQFLPLRLTVLDPGDIIQLNIVGETAWIEVKED